MIFQILKNKIFLPLLLVLAMFTANAQVQLTVSGTSNLDSVNSNSQFIYTLNYQVSSLTSNGINVVSTMPLPQNLVPFDVNNFSNSVAFDDSQVASVTYNSGTNTITITFVSPIPAGSTGQLQVKFKYLNGTTPYHYAPDLFAIIDASNNVNPDLSTGPVYSDTLNILALASNKFSVGKIKDAGGAIDDVTIFQLNIGSSGSGSGALKLTNPVLVDTLPLGVLFVEATAFSGSNAPVYNVSDRTITWTWPTSPFNVNYSSSAFVSVKYTTPTYNIGSTACNSARLFGEIPVLPIGTLAPSNKLGNICFTVESPMAGAACTGGGISAATANWLNRHILAGTSCNTFSNGWYNSGNTQLDSVILTYNIDKSIDMNTIKLRPMFDGFNRKAQAFVTVEYLTNLNPFVVLGTYDTIAIGNSLNLPVTLPIGEYITQVRLKVKGIIPIGATQDFSYCGDARTAAMLAKDGTPIQEGSTYNPSNVGDDGTIVTNASSGSFYYNGVGTNYANCSGTAEIMVAQPVFGFSEKKILNSSSSLRASDTISYQFKTFLGGNVVATNVIVVDTLDSRLSYVPSSSFFLINNVPTPITPTISGNIITWNLGNLPVNTNYAINFKAIIAPGTMPATIPNRVLLISNNGLFNGLTNSINITVISAVAIRAYKGQSGCDPSYVYYPVNAIAQEGGPVNYKITIKNLGNVAAKDLVLVDVFPFISDIRSSQWFANLASVVNISDVNSTVYYTTTSNPCLSNDMSPVVNPPGCNSPVWTITPPIDITSVKAIKIVRSANLPALDSIVLTWLMRAPVGTPVNLLMNNSITYQVSRADNNSVLLPATPNQVGMYTTCIPVLGSIGNYVWIDANKNGLQDEAANLGLNGLKVYLWGAGANNVIGGGDDVLLDSTFSANDFFGNPGYYKFIEVPSGKYYVQFQTNYNQYKATPTVIQTDSTDGNNDSNPLTGFSEIVTIDATASGQTKHNTTIDAGFYPLGSIGNYTWYDTNKNGLQDEPASNGINGLKVYLYREIASVYVIVDSAITANDAGGNPGYYNFVIDESGNYKVQFPVNSSTKILTTQNGSAGVNGNSDAIVGTGFSPVIVMNLLGTGVARNNPTIDAGYKCNVTIPTISGNVNLCTNQSNVLTSSLQYAYQWYRNNSIIVGAINQTYTATLSGNYTVVVTDSGACSSATSTTFALVDQQGSTSNFTINNPIQCNANNQFVFTNTTLPDTIGLISNWSFGDLTSSTNTNPVKSYLLDGNYNVKLVTTNTFGCSDSITKSVYVGNPTASFTYVNKCNGVIEFTNTSINANDFEWIFENGHSYCTNSIDTFLRTFPSGTQMVTLIARNNGNCVDTFTQSITILPNPVAVFSAYPIGCTRTVKFSNFSIVTSNYHWDFGVPIILSDTNNLSSPSYTYPADGTYQVKLIATTPQGCVDSLTTSVVVNSVGISPTAAFTINNLSGNCVNRYSFTNTSTNAVSYQWIFSDGSSVNTTNASKSFGNAGIYQVMLVAKSATGCYDTISQNINVLTSSSGPIAAFAPNQTQSCLANNSFEFSNNSYYIGNGWIPSYQWDFGNGTTNNVNTFIYNKHYDTSGTYTIRLIATGSNGCKDTAYQTIEILPSPTALFTGFTNCGMTLDINNTSSNAVAYIWNFGDNNYSRTTDLSFSHTYLLQNWYNVSLTAIGANGCRDYALKTIVATNGQLPTALFTYDTVGCSNAIRFRNLSTGAAEFSWNFGDGSPIAYVSNPTKVFAAAGNYNVTLTASNGLGCSTTYTLLVHAPLGQNVLLPSAGFTYSVATCSNTISAVDTSTNSLIRHWFLDGVPLSNLSNLTIPNPAAGYHQLKLVVSNGACIDSTVKYILIQAPPTGTFSFASSTCSRTVLFTSNTLNGNYFKWKFNDLSAIVDTAIGNIVSHTFSNNGTYYVQLEVTNLTGCTTVIIDTVVVNASNNSLNASFYSNSTNCNCACTNKIKFTNTSTGSGNLYLWNFGDGNTSTQINPNKGYGTTGFYNVSLTVTNPAGCMSVASSQVFVPTSSKGSSASFSVDNPVQCLSGNNFNFNNTSTYMGSGGYVNKYYWNFGDGTFDTVNTFIFNKHYNAVGIYTVTLVAVGSDNCKDTMTILVQVKATNCLFYSNNVQLFTQSNINFLSASGNTNTGVNEQKMDNNTWKLYPNPNSGTFNISCYKLSSYVTVEVFDILGRKVNTNITKNFAENKLEISCANIFTGNYFVVINNGKDGGITRMKFNITQ